MEDDGLDDNDDNNDYVPPLVKDADSDSDDESDDEADGGVPFFPTSEEEDTTDEGDNPSSPSSQETTPQVNPRRGARVRKPRERFIPTMSGQHHDQGVYPGVNFPQVEKMTDAEKIKTQFAGAGYNTKRGVLNLQFDDAKVTEMSEEQLNAHIVGVIISQQYSLKKGI